MSEVRKKVAAMIWMAIDPRTPEPEAVAALQGIRRMNVGLDELKLALGNASSQVIERVVERTPEFVDPVCPFGKYGVKSPKPMKLSEIAREYPAYLPAILARQDEPGNTWIINDWLRNQIELAILNAK